MHPNGFLHSKAACEMDVNEEEDWSLRNYDRVLGHFGETGSE